MEDKQLEARGRRLGGSQEQQVLSKIPKKRISQRQFSAATNLLASCSQSVSDVKCCERQESVDEAEPLCFPELPGSILATEEQVLHIFSTV